MAWIKLVQTKKITCKLSESERDCIAAVVGCNKLPPDKLPPDKAAPELTGSDEPPMPTKRKRERERERERERDNKWESGGWDRETSKSTTKKQWQETTETSKQQKLKDDSQSSRSNSDSSCFAGFAFDLLEAAAGFAACENDKQVNIRHLLVQPQTVFHANIVLQRTQWRVIGSSAPGTV